MILISHRGNITGKQLEDENVPGYIERAVKLGYDVEIDVWFRDGFYLGHDKPTYKVDIEYLQNNKLWCHAKNIDAIVEMRKYSDIHYFWHQEDDMTITSEGYIWVYPGKQPVENSIAVKPKLNDDVSKCIGICSDFIKRYKI